MIVSGNGCSQQVSLAGVSISDLAQNVPYPDVARKFLLHLGVVLVRIAEFVRAIKRLMAFGAMRLTDLAVNRQVW